MKRGGQESSEVHLSGGGLEVPSPTSTLAVTPASLAILSIGLGAYLGWNTLMVSPSLLPPASAEATALMLSFSFLSQVLLIALVAGLGFWAYKQERLPEKLIIVLSAGLSSAGTAIIYLFGYSDAPVPWVVVAGMLMITLQAGFVALWGKQICSVALRWVPGCVAAGYAISYALGIFVASLRPGGAFVFHALLPLFSGVALWLLNKEPAREAVSRSARTSKLSSHYKFFFGIGLFALIFRLVLDLSEGKAAQPNEIGVFFGGLAAALVIVVVALAYSHEANYSRAVQLLLPTVILCTFLVLFVESGQQVYEVLVIGASVTCFGILKWTMWGIIASRSRASAISVFCTGRVILACCVLLAAPIQALIEALAMPRVVAAAALSILSVLVATFLLSEHYIEDIVKGQRSKLFDVSDLAACKRCVTLAGDRFGLTDREQTISLLVLQGEDNVSIQKRLFITESTLRVHFRNIYAKTGVHRRQEFVSLLESFA